MPESIPSELGFDQKLKAIERLVLELNVQWEMFHDLYADSSNHDIFDRTGPAFWTQLWSQLADAIFLSVSKFFDPAVSSGKENVSMQAIMRYAEVVPFREDLMHRYESLKSVWERGIKDWRHKRIAHSDLGTISGKTKLPDVPLADFETLVNGITGFVREIQHRLYQRDVSYRCSVTGWVPQVLEYLRRGVAQKDEELKTMRRRIDDLGCDSPDEEG